MPVLFFEKFCIISVAVPNNGECQQEMASALQPCLQKGEVGISKEVCVMEVKDYTVLMVQSVMQRFFCRNFWHWAASRRRSVATFREGASNT